MGSTIFLEEGVGGYLHLLGEKAPDTVRPLSDYALHDLTNPGKWDWGNLEVIPYLNTSRLMIMKFCPRLYNWKSTKRLGVPGAYLKDHIVSGSLYHAMADAHDTGTPVLQAIHHAAEKIGTESLYVVSYSETLDYLAAEMYKSWYPRYEKFAAVVEQQW